MRANAVWAISGLPQPLHRMEDLAGLSGEVGGGRAEAGEVAALMQTGAVHSTDPGVLDTFKHFGREEVDLGKYCSEAIDERNLTSCRRLAMECLYVLHLDTQFLQNLTYLNIRGTSISSLNTIPLKNLRQLWMYKTQISSLDTSNLGNLQHLEVSWTNLSSIDTTRLTSLKVIDVTGARIKALDTRQMRGLEVLRAGNTRVKFLSTSGLGFLKYLGINGTKISRVHIVTELKIWDLGIEGSRIRFIDRRTMRGPGFR